MATEIERLDEGPGGAPIISYYGGVSLHEQSHGESFLALIKHRFRKESLFILDEPEAALSPSRRSIPARACARTSRNASAAARFSWS